MSGNLNQIYTIEGSQNQTIDSMRAIVYAKNHAIKTAQKVKVFLNGNPVYLVDSKGHLAGV